MNKYLTHRNTGFAIFAITVLYGTIDVLLHLPKSIWLSYVLVLVVLLSISYMSGYVTGRTQKQDVHAHVVRL